MLECLIGYIGLQACPDQPEPESGIYINTLPGISLESIEKIANPDQVTYAGVWRDAQTAAAMRFKAGFMAALNECYTINKHCDYEQMICDNLEVLTAAWWYLLGNQLMLYRINTSRLNRFTTVDLKQAQELYTHYQVEYEGALNNAMKVVDVSGCCQTQCTNNPERVTWLP